MVRPDLCVPQRNAIRSSSPMSNFGPRSAKEVRKIGEEGLGKAVGFMGI